MLGGFAGEWTDATGLQALRARYYAPTQGRFLTRDTWAGTYTRPASLHRYTCAENNPVLYTDPSGQCLVCVAAAGGALFGAGANLYQQMSNFLGMVGVGALGGAAAGQFGRLAQGLLSGNFWNSRHFAPVGRHY